MAQFNIPGARPLEPRAQWPNQRYSNQTELILHLLLQCGPQTVTRLEGTAPHLDARFTRESLQRAIEEGTVRPYGRTGTSRNLYRITNKGCWALREHWAWRQRYPLYEHPDEPEDHWGMLMRGGRPPQPRPLTINPD